MSATKAITTTPLVAFDTETTGAYPIYDEIVEVGLVKWFEGQVIDRLQFLVKPSRPMGDFVIKIHGITNEMVADKPPLGARLPEVADFMQGAIGLAHHAPFDLGFLVYAFEANNMAFPDVDFLCTSLLARKIITGTPNHKLQTLIPFLGIPAGRAHRADDDAEACLQVFLACARQRPELQSLQQWQELQGANLSLPRFAVLTADNKLIPLIVQAIQTRFHLKIRYEGGSFQKGYRSIKPMGLVRNPEGDFIQAQCLMDRAHKRFYLSKILEAELQEPFPAF